MLVSRRPGIDRGQLEIRELRPDDADGLASFDCGDADLNEFLQADALRLQVLHVTRTYLAFYEGSLVGYVSLLADAVKLKTGERKRLSIGPKSLGHRDHPVVPAIKIARLAVGMKAKASHGGIGTALIAFAFDSAWTVAGTVGCRLLTLDAYPESEGFYQKLGFVRNKDAGSLKHPSMRLDIHEADPSWVFA